MPGFICGSFTREVTHDHAQRDQARGGRIAGC